MHGELGHEVMGGDVDPSKISKLEVGEVPFYEPGLQDMLQRNVNSGRLSFLLRMRKL